MQKGGRICGTLRYMKKGRAKFTTSGAHDVIAITSLPKNDLCTEELRDIDRAKSLDEVSLQKEKLDSVVYFLAVSIDTDFRWQ